MLEGLEALAEQVDVGRGRQAADAAELEGPVLERELELDAQKQIECEEQGSSLPELGLGTTS